MVKSSFATSWKRSTQVRKQRKYVHNAPLHIKQKMFHAHLSPELREKYGFRNFQVRKGDKVRVMRGQFAKKEGKVESVSLKRDKVLVNGVEIIKKDGSKVLFTLNPTNLMIVEFDLTDKKRKQKLESKSSSAKNNVPKTTKKVVNKESKETKEKVVKEVKEKSNSEDQK